MRSHFRLNQGAAVVCAVSGATAMMTGICSAQFSAADYATDPTYASGWSAGQNGGYGFGAWSFNGTDPTPPGTYQGMSSAGAGTAWTLMTHANNTGLANAGRAILGGLGGGQTFETVVQNPSTTAGPYTYRGFDILFTAGPDNDGPGVNTSTIRLMVFDYFNYSQSWHLTDTGFDADIPLTGPSTAAKGLKIDLTLTSATTYSLTMTPLNGDPAYTHNGTYTGPISWVDYRLWNTASSGPGDVADNFGIQYLTVVPEPSALALIGLGSAGLLFLRRRK